MATLQLVVLTVYTLLSFCNGERTLFISSSNGVDQSECGTSSTPCFSLVYALSSILTSSVDESSQGNTLKCFTNSTEQLNIMLQDGEHVIDPVCFRKVRGITLRGMGAVSGIRSSILGNTYGLFAFFDSQEITIDNVTFIDSVIGRSSIYASNTTELNIRHCNLPVYANGAMGVWLVDPYGTVNIANVRFYGNPAILQFARTAPGTALLVTVGDSFSNFGLLGLAEAVPLIPVDILVHNCTFERLISNDVGAINDYRQSSLRSKVVQVLLRGDASGNTVTFMDCLFQDNIDYSGSTVIARISGDATQNYVYYIDCNFLNNTARFGAGIASYFIDSVEDNNVTVTNCLFSYNEASLEGGGVFMAALSRDPQSNSISIKESTFVGNSAPYGAALYLFNDPTLYISSPGFYSISLPVMVATVTDSLFISNRALISEGVITTLRVHLELDGENVLTSNIGSAVLLRSSIIRISDEVLFSYNRAEKGAALRVLDGSLVDMSDLLTGDFSFNEAMFSGGALYVDQSSTTITADQYNHTQAQVALGSCFIQFPSTFEHPEAMIIFSNNTALASGNDFSIFCVRSCFQNYFIPEPFDQYVLTLQDRNPVVIVTDDPLGVLSTGPTYLFFYGASTKCYKQIGDLTYLLPNCSHDLLMDNFNGVSELSCSVEAIISEINENFVPGHGMFHPLAHQLILPWAEIGMSWMLEPGQRRLQCLEPNPGSLLLSPAPGEKFDLTIQLADQLLNLIASSTVFLEVDHQQGQSPGALIQLNGIQWAYNDRVYFTPNRVLSDIALVGLPGTKGHINIVSESQILGLGVILQIPFQLSQCPLGYYYPPIMDSPQHEVDAIILQTYSTTQRIPIEQLLACQCFVDSSVTFGEMVEKYSNECLGGYTVSLSGILWAGLIPQQNETELNELPTVACYTYDNETVQSDRLTKLIDDARAEQLRLLGPSQDPDIVPVDVVPYEGGVTPGGGAPVKCYANYTLEELVGFRSNGEFSVDLCTRGYCRGNVDTSWYLSDVTYPCSENRQGVLCGQCKPQLSLTLTKTKCQDCSNPLPYVPLLVTLVLGLLLVGFVVAFNIGVSPTIDSFLFFIQAVYIIVSSRLDYSDFEALSFFNLDFTFNQCIVSNLQALPRLLLQYVTPLYISSLLLVLLLLSRIKGFAKYFGRHSCLNALWLLILISFLNISNSTLDLLNCQEIGPRNEGFREYVLVFDASVMCWTGFHLPFAIIAVLLTFFVIIPFPFYLGMAIRIPKLKPITDVYCGSYRDNHRYWIVWNLLRRILVVMFSVFITDFVLRHFFLLLLSIGILGVSVATWPYRYWLDNAFGIFVLVMLLVFCIVTQPEVYALIDQNRVVSWSLVTIVCLVTLILLLLEVAIWYMSRRNGVTYSKESFTPTEMRERIAKCFAFTKGRIKKSGGAGKYSELEDSVHSNEYYVRESQDRYKQFREPLIDSEHYFSSVRVQSNNESTQEVAVDSPGINPTEVDILVTHSIVTRDES